MVSSVNARQLRQTDQRVEYTCVSNATTDHGIQHTVNVRAALRMAFVLGARFGVVHPLMAADYMERWITEYTDNTDLAAVRHQVAMENAIFPITHYEDQLEGNEPS